MNLPVFVISLARATERRAAMDAQLQQSGAQYEFVDAVDGANLNSAEYRHRLRQDLSRFHFRVEMNDGEIGCYLSHYNLWQRMVDEQIEYALILEDDAVCDADLFAVAAQLPKVDWHWEVVLIGYKKRKHKAKVLCAVTPGRNLVRYRRPAWFLQAYAISLSGQRKCYGNAMKSAAESTEFGAIIGLARLLFIT